MGTAKGLICQRPKTASLFKILSQKVEEFFLRRLAEKTSQTTIYLFKVCKKLPWVCYTATTYVR